MTVASSSALDGAAPDGAAADPWAAYPDAPAASADPWAAYPDAHDGSLRDMGNFALGGALKVGHMGATAVVKNLGGAFDSFYNSVVPNFNVDSDGPGTKLASAVFNHIMPEYKPAPGLEEGVQSTLGGLAALPLGGGATLMSMISGLTGDIGRQIGRPFGPPAEEAGGLVGSLLPMVPALKVTSPGPVAGRVRAATEHLPAADWDAAIALQNDSNRIGTPLLATEALPSPKLARTTTDTMTSGSGGPILEKFLANRPGQVRTAVNNEILDPITRQPISPSDVGPAAQENATAALKVPEAARTAESGPWFDKAATQNVTAAQLQPVLDKLNSAIALQGNSPTKIRSELTKLRDAIGDEKGNVTTTQIGPVSAPVQDFWNRTDYDPANADAVSKAVSGVVTPHAQAIEKVLQSNNDYLSGRWAHGAMTPPVEKAQALPLRDIAATDNVTTQTGALTKPVAGQAADIKATASAMNVQDNTSFPRLVRSYFQNVFDSVQKGPRAATDNPASGVDFSIKVNGTDQQRANNRAMLEGVAQAHGVPATGLVEGFDTALKVLDRQGSVPGVGSPTVERGGTNSAFSQGFGTSAVKIKIDEPATWLKVVGINSDTLPSFYMQKNYRRFANAITSPDGVRQLRELAFLDPASTRAQIIVGTMIGKYADEIKGPRAPSR